MSRSFDDRMLFSKALRERLDLECQMSDDMEPSSYSWYAVKITTCGKTVIERNFDPRDKSLYAVPDVPVDQMLWAEEACRVLNKECHHDGMWVVGFTHPPSLGDLVAVNKQEFWKRIVKVWLDADGDVSFTADCVDPWWAVAQQSTDHFINQSEQSWKHWQTLMRDVLDPSENQLRPLAKMKEGRA